ncbi:MAG: hypothetical protein DSM106950_22930 [Stigonema ocellatum SAG 48.90 = DSM 106950]|nr:hypothetical protein [Stigonema ocellatum SAG 48.90 = DSM 106950]
MLEKLLLAATLTLTLSIFAEQSWSSPTKTTSEMNRQNQLVSTLIQRHN